MSWRSKRTRMAAAAAMPTPATPTANSEDHVEDLSNETLNDGTPPTGPKIRKGSTTKYSKSTEVPNWSDDIEFDEKEAILTIDADGNENVVGGITLPRDVWVNKKGLKYEVPFNNFNQPIRKGGFLFVRFLGEIARLETFCPISYTNWHHLPCRKKADIIEVVREKFVFPEGKVFNDAVLKHVGKHCRQYRYELKADHFHPNKYTRQQIELKKPDGHDRLHWLALVDYWYKPKRQTLSNIGRRARASQDHLHVNGSTSFANTRAKFVRIRLFVFNVNYVSIVIILNIKYTLEDDNGRPPSSLELFQETYLRADGSCAAETASQEFMEETKSEVETKVANSSPTKSRIDIENEVFDDMMYDKDVPNQRPIGYGFGICRSDVFGVNAELRKRGSTSMHMSREQQQNSKLSKQNEKLSNAMKTLTSDLTQVFEGMRGYVPDSVLEVANKVLKKANDQITESSSGNANDEDEELEHTTEDDEELEHTSSQ